MIREALAAEDVSARDAQKNKYPNALSVQVYELW